MNISLYQAASALQANSRWQEVIAENLASSSIPGFKKEELLVDAVKAGLMPATATAAPQHFLLPRTSTMTNFAPGEIKHTGVPTDLAIEGPAFFEVQMPDGNMAYTRDGQFHLDAQGQVVTKEGYAVMSAGGPIQLDLRLSGTLSISASGEISQGSETHGRLKLVEVNEPQWLTPISGGYLLAQHPDLDFTDSATSTVRQGYLESANTSPVAEMADLITAMRNYEANQRLIHAQDERMSRAIADLGNPFSN